MYDHENAVPTNERVPDMSRILMILTSHDQLGDTGRKTGFWL